MIKRNSELFSEYTKIDKEKTYLAKTDGFIIVHSRLSQSNRMGITFTLYADKNKQKWICERLILSLQERTVT